MDVVEKHIWNKDIQLNAWKDYAISWILYGVWTTGLWENLVLKGGTCLRKAYFPNYRLSIDIDYTTVADLEPENIKDKLTESVQNADKGPINFMTENMRFRIRYGKKYHPGRIVGYAVGIPFKPPIRYRGQPLTIHMDITFEKYEKILDKIMIKNLQHSYEDEFESILRNTQIKTYSLEEIFAEKIRSLFQRVRVRDLYDVWFLRKHVDMKVVENLLPKKFEIKGISFNVSTIYDKKLQFKDGWNKYLQGFMPQIPQFEDVWNSVMETISTFQKEHKRNCGIEI